ncbi:hypothetical protein FFL34_13250 [Lentibacillus cibarius]|uniref:Membrane transport protein MMPL domain-containing protein n=1 Tax=Lentibacillus cibarius TaxID=2583219 RepID=A0A5S3QQ41_9BACI|nr:hypothetical protein FFL34_13250 [Lentibacillus cibarius]
MQTTNKQIGKAIFASALTTIGGFSALLVSDFVILNNFGIMISLNKNGTIDWIKRYIISNVK